MGWDRSHRGSMGVQTLGHNVDAVELSVKRLRLSNSLEEVCTPYESPL